MYEQGQLKLNTKEAINELKKLIESEKFGIDEIVYVEEEDLYMIIDNEKKRANITTIYDKLRPNLFYIDDREEFFKEIVKKLSTIISNHALTHSYDLYELELERKEMNGYTILYFIDVFVDHRDNGVSVRRRMKVIKVDPVK